MTNGKPASSALCAYATSSRGPCSSRKRPADLDLGRAVSTADRAGANGRGPPRVPLVIEAGLRLAGIANGLRRRDPFRHE